MRIAFTSCFSASLFPAQPVWDEIAQEHPDVLVLLGDSVYLDGGNGLTLDGSGPLNAAGLQSLSDRAFAAHAHREYQKQLAHPGFQNLLGQRPRMRVFAIWDDHDFLWDNARGGDLAGKTYASLVYPSRALFKAWCDTLAGTSSFPSQPPDWSSATPAPGYHHVPLGQDVHLHLTDGRSWRESGGKALLGASQTQQLQAKFEALGPQATHLLASGSTVEQNAGESWGKCKDEYDWLHRMASKYNILVLSGDIHKNELSPDPDTAPAPVDGHRMLFEATASGAAVRTLVGVGVLRSNYGLLDVDADKVRIRLFQFGRKQWDASIARKNWNGYRP